MIIKKTNYLRHSILYNTVKGSRFEDIILAKMYSLLIVFTCVTFSIYTCYAENDVEKRMQKLFRRPDLRCSEYCDKSFSFDSGTMQCCVCSSTSVLEQQLGALDVKYLPGSETALVQNNGIFSFYGFVHRTGNLTKLPVNSCLFNTSMFIIDLSFNRIHDITGIACLQVLDTLILKGNQIQIINNQDILNLKFLRRLDLSFNNIKRVEPSLTINAHGSLFDLDLSHNEFQYVDVTNMVMTKQQCFCTIDFSYNKIQKLVNENKWVCQSDTDLGYGGMVNLSNNIMTEFFDIPEFRSLGFTPFTRLGQLIHYGFDVRKNKWNCDCKFYPYANLAKVIFYFIKRDYFYVKCFSPPDIAGSFLIDIIINNPDKLVCNLPMSAKCPPRCHCLYQPAIRNRTLVNCQNTEYRHLPNALPSSNDIEVDFSDNKVVLFPQNGRRYFQHIKLLNMSWNTIETITETDLSPLIDCTIDLSHNPITTISQSLQVLKPCNIYLNTVLTCKCKDKWIKEWLPSEHCADRVSVLCNTPGGLKPIQSLSDKDLGCLIPNQSIPNISKFIVVTVLCIVAFGILSFSFRYEIFVIARETLKTIRRRRTRNIFTYDVYISCNDADPSVRQWVLSTLLSQLSGESQNVFLPFLHSELGTPREEEIINVMSKCRTFLVILSANYDGPIKWHEIEWKHAWHNWARDFNRELIIVNYDMVTASEVSSKYIRACIRLGRYIDFANRNKKIEREIQSRI